MQTTGMGLILEGGFNSLYKTIRDFPGGSAVKNLSANAGDAVFLEEEMATYSNVLAWEIPWREDPGGPQYLGLQKSRIQHRDKNNTSIAQYEAGSLWCLLLSGSLSFPNSELGC